MLREYFHKICHTCFHVIKVMAVMEPDSRILRNEFDGAASHLGRNEQGVFLYSSSG